MANATLTLNAGRQYVLAVEVAFDYTHIADTGVAVTAVKLPVNSEVVGGALIVDTAFDPGTSLVLDIGDSGSANRYGNDIDLEVAARTALTLTGYKNTSGLDMIITPTLVSTAPTEGAARLLVEYIIVGRAHEAQTN